MAGVVRLSKLKNPTKALFTLTPAAKDRIRFLMDQQARKKSHSVGAVSAENARPLRPAAVRIGVRKGGCNGFVYTMHFADEIRAADETVRDEDITIIVDPKALISIVGTEMDFQKSKLKSEFVFTNPNATGTCGCGESFSTNVGSPPFVPSNSPVSDQSEAKEAACRTAQAADSS